MSPWTITVLLVVLGGLWSLAAHLQDASRARQGDHHRLPPGPRGLPILGNLLMLGDFPHHTFRQLAKKYGPIMYIRLGLVRTMVVSSPQVAKLFLNTHDLVFASRPYNMVMHIIAYGNKGIAFSPYGPYWRNVRKLCTIQLLSAAKVDSLKHMRKEEVGLFVRLLKDHSGVVVDVSAKVGSLIEDMTYWLLIGSKVDRFNLKPVVQEAFILIGAFNLADYIPCLGSFDLQGLTRRMKAIGKVFDEFLEKIIDEHIQDAKNRQNNHKDDFIDVMLLLMKESQNATDEQGYMIDRTNIKAIILDILVAAMDTSIVTVEWALSELLRHPKVLEKLQEELRDKVGMDRVVEEEDLVKLNYLDMVVKEVMRLHPVAPLLAPRESMEDITINGYHIPKKSRVIINAWAIQRDPIVWSDNAEEFLPERFIDNNNIDIRRRDYQFIPFGSGRRGCPGIHLGLVVVKLVLAQMVHCFDWELPNGMSPDDLDMTEKFGLTVARASHLLAIPTYRL
ncbi:cytochrome P450 CYP736A12-like [Telopea speciosissima]|uniref:cytochrome P450 CYP736A12-like n=1 Tax=Telopea speciosissima TaxID=54955 RepID=UPI001CC557C6|nr:cytochrome P450 CYP736A12-like [Telopea speciosissima]